MATDAWKVARDGVGRLLGRVSLERQAAIEAQLDANAALVQRAYEPEQARQALAPVWQLRLTQLLEGNPDLGPALRDLTAQIQKALPAQHQQWVQTTSLGTVHDCSPCRAATRRPGRGTTRVRLSGSPVTRVRAVRHEPRDVLVRGIASPGTIWKRCLIASDRAGCA